MNLEYDILKLHIAHLPTPIEHAPNLSISIGGPEIWIKRDDQTGLAFGGNKTRKLEYLIAEAKSEDAELLMTRGAAQSNHCRQTAAAAAKMDFKCKLILSGSKSEVVRGNLLLDQLFDAEIVWTGKDDPDVVLRREFEREEEKGSKPYLIPYGGSNKLGVYAYAAAIS